MELKDTPTSKSALVVGGSSGIGLSFVIELLHKGYERVIIASRSSPEINILGMEHLKIDLNNCDFRLFKNYQDVDTVMVSAGIGRIASFDSFEIPEIERTFRVNTIAVINLIQCFYQKLLSCEDFNFVVISSIAGLISSPLFSLYAVTKAALNRFVESVNIELEMSGSKNRILNVSPGFIKGTKFYGGKNNMSLLTNITENIYANMQQKNALYIPYYDKIYREVLEQYHSNPHEYGVQSYQYKIKSNRINSKSNLKIGYLSGTFDLFHIGHLNLIRRAKEYCDYLVVGVHKDASHKGKKVYIPLEQRMEIVRSVRYVDDVILSKPEDIDVYNDIHYDYLFVGSDYKGTKRFLRYENFFASKDVKIIYFPYTSGISSTDLRIDINRNNI